MGEKAIKGKAIAKVLSCLVVSVLLMSTFSVAVIATDSSNSTASNVTDKVNSSVESVALSNNITCLTCRDDLIQININKTETVVNGSGNSDLLDASNTSSPDIISESDEVPDPDLPVINDTDINIAKTVSSMSSCSYVWIKITDKYCYGYKVYVDGVYQFTEGESGTPDGYCSFKVTPGYHTFKLTLNGKEVSKGWNCQCGVVYNWMSMNDMIPHWCEDGGGDCDNPPTVSFDKSTYYEGDTVHITVHNPISGQVVDYEIIDCEGNSKEFKALPYGTSSIYYTLPTVSSCCYWKICFYWNEGQPPLGAGSYCTKCYSFYVCPHETSCKVWIDVEDKYCKGYEVYVDGVYQFTEGESGTPDGYCRFWVTPGTHKFELRKDGCSVSKSWYCQCGTSYRWISMNDMDPHWCECHKPTPPPVKEVKFRGTVTGTSPEGLIGAIYWYVSVDEWISGSLPCDEIDVTIAMCPPWGSYDNSISKGDKVEVYGKVDPWGEGKNCEVGLNGESYYIKKIPSDSLSLNVWTDKSEYKIGETVTIYYQTNKKCTAKLTITKPDGGDVVYGPNEIPASTRSKSATAGYPTGKRTVVFEAWAGAEYKKATCYFEGVEEAKKVKIRGEILVDSPIISFYSFDVKLDEILDDPTGNLRKGEIVNVYGHRSGPAQVDDVTVGDKVEVFGEYRGYVEGATFERIFLSDWGESSSDHYVKIIEPTVWNVKFEGIISKIFNKESSNWYDAKIKVAKVIDDPSHTLDVNEIVNVYRANENAYEDAVSVGDLVEVCAEYNSKYEDSGYALGDWQHHIKKMEVTKPVHNIDTGKDFATIQAAIDDSDTGHTITVDPGTYTENVDVTKSLTIKSTSGNPKDTIVQPAVSNQNYQNVFTVTTDNVNIDGFTIKGASYFWCSGILLNSNNCIISNNTFEGNAIGIWIHPPSLGNNIIRNNQFSSSSGYSPSTALYLEAANNKIYLNNFIIGMEWGSGNVWNSPTQITYEYEGNTFTSHLGNYWDDYRDTDANGDGIWDHPYSIEEGKDNYPLVDKFENYVSVEEKPEIKFRGTFEYSRSIWNGNAQQYFFSVDKVLLGKDVTCSRASVVIPLNKTDKKLDAISSILKTLKKGDTVLIYAELKSQVMICDLGFSSDKYFVHRYSTDLEEEYRQQSINIGRFYINFSLNVLTYQWWQLQTIESGEEGLRVLYNWAASTIATAPFFAYISDKIPIAGEVLNKIGLKGTVEFIQYTVPNLLKTAKFSEITQIVAATDTQTLKNDLLIHLRDNVDQLDLAIERGEEISSILSDRRVLLIRTYRDICILDQNLFNHIKTSNYLLKIDDYAALHNNIALLATVLNTDFVETTAFMNYYTGSTLNYNLAQAAGCDLQRHRLDDEFWSHAHYFGYFNRKGDTDRYKLTIPSDHKMDVTVAVATTGNTILILKQTNGKEISQRKGEKHFQTMKSDAIGDYILEVQSDKCAQPYKLVIDTDFYMQVEPLS